MGHTLYMHNLMVTLEGGWENLEGHTLYINLMFCGSGSRHKLSNFLLFFALGYMSIYIYRPFSILSSFIFWHLPTSVGSELTRNIVRCTMETLISGHPRDVKKVSITGAGRLREC